MKKDKEWLKKELDKSTTGFNGRELGRYEMGRLDGYTHASMLIDQLDEPEILSLEWIDENKVARIDDVRKMTTSVVLPVEKLKNLLVPKQDKQEVEENFYTFDNAKKWLQENGFVVFEKDKLDEEVQRMIDETYKAMNEKPVIPKFVADWIDAHNLHGNNPLREYRDLESDFNEGWTEEKDAAVYHWVNENPYAFIDMLRYGYEVEKEKLYHVVNKENYFLLRKYDGFVGILHTLTAMSRDKYGKDTRFMLTEQEIKDYDERFLVFAEEVTE